MELFEIADVIDECSFPDYCFSVERDGRGEMYLQAEYEENDTVLGLPMVQATRRWFLSPHMTRSELVQTVFKCVITSMEHRAREWFRYRQQPVFSPHFDVDALVEICRAGRFSDREAVKL